MEQLPADNNPNEIAIERTITKNTNADNIQRYNSQKRAIKFYVAFINNDNDYKVKNG